MKKKIFPKIPYDVYDSPNEILILMPLGGVRKQSIEVKIENYRLVIVGERVQPSVKKDLKLVIADCYRGRLEQKIDLPSQVYFDKIHSKLSVDNILEIVVPKSSIPERVKLEIDK